MKKLVFLSVITIIGSSMMSCNPEAKFIFDPEKIEAPATIKFTNQSENAKTYEWDFGDGSETSTESSPNHEYLHRGSYEVKLTASNNSKSDDFTQTIEIDLPIQLFPGKKMLDIELNEEWSTVKKKIDSGYTTEYKYIPDFDLYFHTIIDVSDNFYIYTIGSSASLSNDDEVIWLEALNDFEGTTPEGIGLGDDFTTVKDTYKTPNQENSWFSSNYESYDYDDLGIAFAKESSGTTISMIMIYPSSEKSATINSKFNIPTSKLKRLISNHISR